MLKEREWVWVTGRTELQVEFGEGWKSNKELRSRKETKTGLYKSWWEVSPISTCPCEDGFAENWKKIFDVKHLFYAHV